MLNDRLEMQFKQRSKQRSEPGLLCCPFGKPLAAAIACC